METLRFSGSVVALSGKITIGYLALTCDELCSAVCLWNSLALATAWLVTEKRESRLIRYELNGPTICEIRRIIVSKKNAKRIQQTSKNNRSSNPRTVNSAVLRNNKRHRCTRMVKHQR